MSVKEWQPKIIGFCCNWCSYAGADLAGISRLQQPPNVRVIRVPCSGRVNPQFILKAFQHGADGVLVAGCHPGDCHYATGNYFTRRRFLIFKRLLEYVGYEPGRLRARWISGAEGQKFASTTREIVEEIKLLGPNRRLR
ncbi:hydrogenase iron-sulfur subunit [Carboxydocella sp. JDF658]|uniref:hydrogenase iron-sulfur subunit n=1 Tax=Carboxydocella sp. JDF658 TaxID=1926600 RepID=UPI0009AEDA99|nr:hydrogenase iron-sulfur subunit [Carboxydocella sp. JDF658]